MREYRTVGTEGCNVGSLEAGWDSFAKNMPVLEFINMSEIIMDGFDINLCNIVSQN